MYKVYTNLAAGRINVKCLSKLCIIFAVATASESLRIGEFSRRVGVSAELLRAWERRYGLLQPLRSPGGFRLYGAQDAERVARMRDGLSRGLSAAQAAAAALSGGPKTDGLADEAAARLLEAIYAYDEARTQAVLDEGLEAFGLEVVLGQVIMPVLTDLGLGWRRDALAIAREHFASNVIRARLLSLSRLWGRGTGPTALLACPEGERHDISLIAFGLVLRSHGWRIVFLGADTPVETIERAVDETGPGLTVLSSFDTSLLEAQKQGLRRLGRRANLLLGGPGATEELCASLRARRLDGDLIAAAAAVASEPRA